MKKVTDLHNLSELFSQLDPQEVENLVSGNESEDNAGENEEIRNYKTIATTSLVTVVSYLFGMDEDKLRMHYGEFNDELIGSLLKNKEATIIRYLCRFRTSLLLNFLNTDNEMRFNLGNIDRMSWFHADEIKKLRNWGIEVVHTNYRSDKYSELFCELIAEHIDSCRGLFPDWVNFEYIKDLLLFLNSKSRMFLKKSMLSTRQT